MNRSAAGFTLLEVVVALAVVALALGGTMSIASSSAANTGYLERSLEAHWVARNVAATVSLLPSEERQQVVVHSETMLGRRYDARTHFEPASDGLVGASITVSNDGMVLANHTVWLYGE